MQTLFPSHNIKKTVGVILLSKNSELLSFDIEQLFHNHGDAFNR